MLTDKEKQVLRADPDPYSHQSIYALNKTGSTTRNRPMLGLLKKAVKSLKYDRLEAKALELNAELDAILPAMMKYVSPYSAVKIAELMQEIQDISEEKDK